MLHAVTTSFGAFFALRFLLGVYTSAIEGTKIETDSHPNRNV